ncbi:MAG: carboxymuconolactone decarboxylase family protein [Chloroflexia bacterium]|nr:carboxymuconolactone decarboxylase family protein [Chloroflexia bacterium]
MNYTTVDPGVLQAMLRLNEYFQDSDLEPQLLELMHFRASQINGCAYCLEMHARQLRERGEPEHRLYVLDAWRDAPFYTDRERAALAWTEAVTRLTDGQVPDDDYAEARAQFDERELAGLTLAVVAINGWNRLNIAFRNEPAMVNGE